MKAIILAAGRGERLQQITQGKPKCLLQFGSRTLIEHQLNALKSAHVKDVIIILGYERKRLQSFLEGLDFNFSFVINDDYLTTNTIYSLWLAREFMDSDFLYFNADVLAEKTIVTMLLNHEQENVLAITKARCAEEEVKIILKSNTVAEIGKKLNPEDCAGEFIGIGKFSAKTNPFFIKCLEKYVSTSQKNLFFEKAVNDFCKTHPIFITDVTDIPCIEIDFPEDYYNAIQLAKTHHF